MAQPLLKDHSLFRSSDLDEARERVAAVFCPHRLETLGARSLFDACHHHLPGQRLSLNYIEYGAKTLIAPGELGGFYLLQIPLEGGAEVTNGRETYLSTPTRAAILNPHLPTRMTWEEGTRQVLVQVSRRALQDHLAGLLNGPSGRPLTFDGPLDLSTEPGAALRRLVMWLVAEVDAGNPPIGPGLMARQIESTVLSGLLEARHDHHPQLARIRSAPRPRHLRLAEGFIEAHLDQPITLEDVASAAGISPRGLQMAFREHRGTTPLAFWREARLVRAHADLLTAEPGARVTDIALRWGFTHFGRFSELYRERYGLCPRDTLRAGVV
jgi:AraC-like DNA-binding protein